MKKLGAAREGVLRADRHHLDRPRPRHRAVSAFSRTNGPSKQQRWPSSISIMRR
jgi:hypothetical protein